MQSIRRTSYILQVSRYSSISKIVQHTRLSPAALTCWPRLCSRPDVRMPRREFCVLHPAAAAKGCLQSRGTAAAVKISGNHLHILFIGASNGRLPVTALQCLLTCLLCKEVCATCRDIAHQVFSALQADLLSHHCIRLESLTDHDISSHQYDPTPSRTAG